MKRVRSAIFGLVLILTQSAFTGTTGKLAGSVMDAKTQTPLPGATVLVEGTPYGAVAEADGRYVILNLAPGVYALRARLRGMVADTLAPRMVPLKVVPPREFALRIVYER